MASPVAIGLAQLAMAAAVAVCIIAAHDWSDNETGALYIRESG